eukprot:CAMPEP_0177441504 /NCGR_PEP_ID=MMETSP0369-20130122/4442_1 /TAXON_ID=447022 ORGANISM="Scrippsiella hangoei-like, Strain SHHI-4" /NCGR_SAMPLE_ID=MMETSP0369 /ASSEMBLY_ACC=CAM_ASM_000364 /LENGTH=132 /DNA_ID=CAMNT_0018913379 /DNA_START=793 /DNA_END=1191 /DNA_ORIENTATION=-
MHPERKNAVATHNRPAETVCKSSHKARYRGRARFGQHRSLIISLLCAQLQQALLDLTLGQLQAPMWQWRNLSSKDVFPEPDLHNLVIDKVRLFLSPHDRGLCVDRGDTGLVPLLPACRLHRLAASASGMLNN